MQFTSGDACRSRRSQPLGAVATHYGVGMRPIPGRRRLKCQSLMFCALCVSSGMYMVATTVFLNVVLLKQTHPVDNAEESTLGRSRYYLWNESDSLELPLWFQAFVKWHRQTRNRLTIHNWKDFRYLLVRCVERDRVCGGAADRLYPLPAIFYLAHISRRLVFIYWTRPAPLEMFLVPNRIDWRLPVFLIPLLHADAPTHPWSFQRTELVDGSWERNPSRLITVKALYHGLGEYYNSVASTPLAQSYHAIWDAAFQPSQPILRTIQSTMDELKLKTNQYAGLHIRSLYQINATLHENELKNAVHCAVSMVPNATIFVTADAPSSATFAAKYGKRLGYQMVHRKSITAPPLHLDRGRDFLRASNDWKNHQAEDYYDVFVDLYLLSASRCISTGVGGFGVWASHIGQHSDCLFRRDDTAAKQSFCNNSSISQST